MYFGILILGTQDLCAEGHEKIKMINWSNNTCKNVVLFYFAHKVVGQT